MYQKGEYKYRQTGRTTNIMDNLSAKYKIYRQIARAIGGI
jgi:hypothetical protein